MKALIFSIAAVYSLAACNEEKKSSPPPAIPVSTAASRPGTNVLKAPIDRTRNVMEQVKQRNGNDQP